MITARRPAGRLLQRLSRSQQRRHASQEEVTGPQSISSGHSKSAGQYQPVSHGHHPEPVNESLGVRLPAVSFIFHRPPLPPIFLLPIHFRD